MDASVSGGWAGVSGGEIQSSYVSGNYHLNYDGFLTPGNAVAVFEVSLKMNYSGYNGRSHTDCASGDLVMLCPYVVVNA